MAQTLLSHAEGETARPILIAGRSPGKPPISDCAVAVANTMCRLFAHSTVLIRKFVPSSLLGISSPSTKRLTPANTGKLLAAVTVRRINWMSFVSVRAFLQTLFRHYNQLLPFVLFAVADLLRNHNHCLDCIDERLTACLTQTYCSARLVAIAQW